MDIILCNDCLVGIVDSKKECTAAFIKDHRVHRIVHEKNTSI